MIIRALSLHGYDAKPLECISGANISFAYAMKFILHAMKLLPHSSSIVLKLGKARGKK